MHAFACMLDSRLSAPGPYADLWLAVIEQAIHDGYLSNAHGRRTRGDRQSAIDWLHSETCTAIVAMLGLDWRWFQSVLQTFAELAASDRQLFLAERQRAVAARDRARRKAEREATGCETPAWLAQSGGQPVASGDAVN